MTSIFTLDSTNALVPTVGCPTLGSAGVGGSIGVRSTHVVPVATSGLVATVRTTGVFVATDEWTARPNNNYMADAAAKQASPPRGVPR